jgi:regulator of protease activity HflC (stomatin/prohibitin superfamily)
LNKLEQIRHEAQQQVIQAEAEKNATIARALGEAEAAIIEADATAAAIQVITSQMTPEYAQYLWLTQWDGKLPLVVGEGTGLIIDVNSLLEETAPGG